jgi:hypothetical protein
MTEFIMLFSLFVHLRFEAKNYVGGELVFYSFRQADTVCYPITEGGVTLANMLLSMLSFMLLLSMLSLMLTLLKFEIAELGFCKSLSNIGTLIMGERFAALRSKYSLDI